MAKRRPTSSGSSPKGTADDAFTAGILRFVVWARNRTEVLIGAVVVVVLVIGGAFFFMGQRSAQFEEASLELQTIQQTVFFSEPDEAARQLRDYLSRHGGTPFGIEARLTLAEILLDNGDPDEAVAVLSEVAPSFRDPLRVQATALLAVAKEAAEDWQGAADVYRQLADRAELRFQRRDAAEGLARSHLALNDTTAAIQAFQRAMDQLDEDDEVTRNLYQMRLAELTGGEMP
ncbi:MAG: hypothetical protein EA422_08545 [Gemmatimonadales bacterium]|nr:MAG: hypothetical protein EA422_08545 [Gemmatimonadales bacterium]